ncbi:hypothetical protein ABEB36_013247 [Hypothenemus hampei]|uniref:Uncharacterized protein n=1 Tax=Hypothenemus hampei TaxID=57062 RepID=A0ABD1E9E6_HYPHA
MESTKLPLFLLCVLLFESGYGTIPDYIKVCHRSDPKVAACVKDSVESLRSQLVKGIPELEVPAIDPFTIDEIVVFDGEEIPNLKVVLKNIVATGFGKFEITKLKLDIEKKTYRVGVRVPFMDCQGSYDVDSKWLGTAVKTSGDFQTNATGIDGQAVIQASVDEENHMKMDSMVMKLKVEDFNFNLPNLLKEDPALAQVAKAFLDNSSKKDLLRLGMPYIEKKCSEILLKMANKIVKNLDYDEVFPQ